MTWRKDGNLACSSCNLVLEYPGPRVVVLNAARAHNWHCFTGKSLTDKNLDVHLCPDCVGTVRSRKVKATPALNGDVPLFDVQEKSVDHGK